MRHIAVFIFLITLVTSGFSQGFTITDFNADLNLQKDGHLGITETITTVFSEEHHGIFRTIPVDYDNGKGATRSIQIGNIRVTDEAGRKLETKVSQEGANVKIRIGDADSYVPVGVPVVYVIRYSSYGQLNWFDQDDTWQPYVELYWNLTGNEWPVGMDAVRFRVHFPRTESKDVRARLYVGSYGTQIFQEMTGAHTMTPDSNAATALSLSSATLEGKLQRALSPYEGATVVLDLPATLIQKPTKLQEAAMFAQSNMGLGIPVLALLVMFIAWLKVGKDPANKPIAVQFEPPDNLSGPEAGTLLDERVDPCDISSGVISLAVRGYIVIHPQEVGLIFKKRSADLEILEKPAGPELSRFEERLLSKLRSAGGMVDENKLRIYVAPSLSNFKEILYNSLVDRGYYLSNPDSVRTGWGIGGLVVVAALAFAFAALNSTGAVWPSVVGGILGAIIVLVFAQLMPRRTYRGAEAQRQVKGFEEFIRRAKGQEINWIDKKQPTMALFEEYLPHAVAFGLATEWASAFDGILHEMPNWYAAPYGTPFYPGYFGSDISTISNSLGSAAGTPPRSSGASGGGGGFSGGGFSGGGFGGGGGGSW